MNRPTITSDQHGAQYLAELIYREARVDLVFTVNYSDTSNNYYSATLILDGPDDDQIDGFDIREAIIMDAEDVETSIEDLLEKELNKVFNLKQ